MKKRGAHPKDQELFHLKKQEILKNAVKDLSWLLTRGYPKNSSLTLVGNRYSLKDRQRIAVGRCSFSKEQIFKRKKTNIKKIKDQVILIDGFNILTTVETFLGGGIILQGQDGVIRDMASVHGTYRLLRDTPKAIELIGKELQKLKPKKVIWYLDYPVSNSGRLKVLLEKLAKKFHWKWEVNLVQNPDQILISKNEITLTGDSGILDNISKWFNILEILLDQKRVLKL
jgi:hypothetical protein